MSGIDTGIVVDMGGTTTDIAILRNGIPQVKVDGATVGEWRMSIRAADIAIRPDSDSSRGIWQI